MEQAVNSLIIELLKLPLILIFVIVGVCGITFKIAVFLINMKRKQKNNVHNNENDILEKICPECGGKMVLRNGKYGQFYGCENYPKCKHTDKI